MPHNVSRKKASDQVSIKQIPSSPEKKIVLTVQIEKKGCFCPHINPTNFNIINQKVSLSKKKKKEDSDQVSIKQVPSAPEKNHMSK